MNIRDLILDQSAREIQFRPYRLAGESIESYRVALGDAAPKGPFAVDLAPTLEHFVSFVEALIRARLTNVDRDQIEVEYRKGLWDDAWDGFFYYPALLLSHVLAYDQRLADVPGFSEDLRYFHDVRAHRKGHYIFLKKGATEVSYIGNSLTLPIPSLSNAIDDLNLADATAIFGNNVIDELKVWIGIEHESSRAARIDERRSFDFDVFLSHCSKDAGQARSLVEFLAAAGKRVFFSPDSLPALGSTEYMRVIDDAIDGSKHFILFATRKENLLSSWVEAEWRLFINEKRSGRKPGNFLTTIPADLPPAELPLSLRYYEVVPWHADYLNRIIKYIN